MPLEYNHPRAIDHPTYKYEVLVWDPQAKKGKLIRFGSRAYDDYRVHRDPARRLDYLRRSAGIRDGQGRLTKDNPLSKNYWSRRWGWRSAEEDFTSEPE